MAAILPTKQLFTDFSNLLTISINLLKLTSSSDTFTLPNLSEATSGLGVKQLERTGDPTVTVTNSTNTVTVAGGSAGDEVVVVGLHAGNLNYNPEA